MSETPESTLKTYEDDKSISNVVRLYRRVLNKDDPRAQQIIWDEIRNRWRPSSGAFGDHPNGSPMSVALGDTLEQLMLPPETVLSGYQGYSLGYFTAEVARSVGLGIVRAPLQEDRAHGEVFGEKSRKVKRALVENFDWQIPPTLTPPKDN